MSIKVTTQPRNRISINAPQVDIKSVGVSNKDTSIKYLRALKDVNATVLANNQTIVYDSASDNFIVKELPIVNGGIF